MSHLYGGKGVCDEPPKLILEFYISPSTSGLSGKVLIYYIELSICHSKTETSIHFSSKVLIAKCTIQFHTTLKVSAC